MILYQILSAKKIKNLPSAEDSGTEIRTIYSCYAAKGHDFKECVCIKIDCLLSMGIINVSFIYSFCLYFLLL